ncbi:MAG: LTA synthase family protein [Bacteroidales bacterium]|nr:LTA synthase family protein [Bacteroidales bacterium]
MEKKHKGRPLSYLLTTYLLGMGLFTLFRITNTLAFRIHAGPQNWGSGLLKAFAMGLRFDTVISCYILSIPLVWIVTGHLCGMRRDGYYRGWHLLTVLLYLTAFLACAADIPYFNYFFTRLNVSAFSWMDSLPFVVKMIVEEPAFILYLFLFLAVGFCYVMLMRRIRLRWLTQVEKPERILPAILLGILLAGCCMIGMRGRLSIKSPIRTGTAYFSDNAFLNQLGLNPMFTLLSSMREAKKNKELHLIDSETARQVATGWLPEPRHDTSGIIRLSPDCNVVVVIMESMAACKVGHFRPERNLTPHLDSLIAGSLIFENAYSAGIHTHNGIYSTLFSQPAIPGRHSMKWTVIPKIDGMPALFHSKGYQTIYFTTHDEQFDNVAGFLYANGIRRIISQKDYPAKEVKSTLGVPDHVMFDRAIEELGKERRPFFACLMTASDHNPYILPDDIGWEPRSKNISEKMVEYADWAIGRFIRKAKQTSWFANTLFVFVADHGSSDESLYDMPLSYHHVPLLFYAPGQIKPDRRSDLALQTDIGPTIAGMIFDSEYGNPAGIDLQRQRRTFAYFSADDKIGVLDSVHFYRYRMSDGNESMYRYRNHETVNLLPEYMTKADSMRRYGFSMIQQAYDKLNRRP